MIPARTKEIDRAWLQHTGRAGIPVEVWRQVRTFKGQLAAPAAVIRRALSDTATTKQLISDFARKGHVGKARALSRLKKAFPTALFRTDGDTVEFRWLEPYDGPIIADPHDPGEMQPCVGVFFAVGGPRTARSTAFMSVLALEAPDHSLGRILQRSPATDLRAVLYEAAERFLQADSAEVAEHIRAKRTLYLKGGDGIFLTNAIKSVDASGQRSVYSRPRTWITREAARADQIPVAVAEHPDNSVWALIQMMAEKGLAP